jgi:hypothetical protein
MKLANDLEPINGEKMFLPRFSFGRGCYRRDKRLSTGNERKIVLLMETTEKERKLAMAHAVAAKRVSSSQFICVRISLALVGQAQKHFILDKNSNEDSDGDRQDSSSVDRDTYAKSASEQSNDASFRAWSCPLR